MNHLDRERGTNVEVSSAPCDHLGLKGRGRTAWSSTRESENQASRVHP